MSHIYINLNRVIDGDDSFIIGHDGTKYAGVLQSMDWSVDRVNKIKLVISIEEIVQNIDFGSYNFQGKLFDEDRKTIFEGLS